MLQNFRKINLININLYNPFSNRNLTKDSVIVCS